MIANNKTSLLAHGGICLVLMYMSGLGFSFTVQLVLATIAFALYFIMGGIAFSNQGTPIKNLFSVSAASIVGAVLSVICCITYQYEVINKYNYTVETLHYKVIRALCFGFNTPFTPFARLIGEVYQGFMLPYGWLCTFFVPTAAFWLGLQWRVRKERLKSLTEIEEGTGTLQGA
ncbi:MAG: hypothetical protein N3B21_03705 [Clostridia bacterium]|nr:hypothetical protein [Clostridia bacterium]